MSAASTYKEHVKAEIRLIDAIGDAHGGWHWNDSYILESDVYFSLESLTPRRVLSTLREWGYLSEHSRGRVKVEDYGDLIEIVNRYTGEPILALLIELL